jgi:hypothetical protein
LGINIEGRKCPNEEILEREVEEKQAEMKKKKTDAAAWVMEGGRTEKR